MKKALFIFGTRPEAIKLAPVIRAFKERGRGFKTVVCVTAQHRKLLDQVLDFFGIVPDHDLDLMKDDQTLFDITSVGIAKIEKVLEAVKPDVVFVQGDTTSVFASALAAFYKRIPVAHIEAGLRSFDKYSPYPEEANRHMTSVLAEYHFAPTECARRNLEKENIRRNVKVVGNTVVDALFLALDTIEAKGDAAYRKKYGFIKPGEKNILVTAHRRENFGKPFASICRAIREIAVNNEGIRIIYPLHQNPNIKAPANKMLSGVKNIHLVEPVRYDELVWLMKNSYLILTDSGGIQEEAPSLGKPVLVLRNVTERHEGIKAGSAMIVGTECSKIVSGTARLLKDKARYNAMSHVRNPYGDGKSSDRILSYILRAV